MDSKPPVAAAKPLRRKVHVVYYLSRGGGQMDHPHLLEGFLSAAQDGLRLRDFKRWLSVLRGKSMPSAFAWSYKRTYKNGFIWHDLGDNDMILPLSKNEYVLMGSEIKEHGALGKCKCGALQQQTEVKEVATELGNIQEEPLGRSGLRSPKPVTKNSLVNTEDDVKSDGVMQIRGHSGRKVTSDSVGYDTKMISSKSGGGQFKGGSSRSFNEGNVQRLLEEVKRPTNYYQETNKQSTNKSFNQSRNVINARVMIRDSDVSEDQEEIVEDDEVQGELLYEGGRLDMKKGSTSSPYTKQAVASTAKTSRRDYINNGNRDDLIAVTSDGGHDNDYDSNGTHIVDAATQTGDSTSCSTDHQDGTPFSARYSNMLELMDTPPNYSVPQGYMNAAGTDHTIRRLHPARPNKNQQGGSGSLIRGNLARQLSPEFAHHSPDVDKAMMITQSSELGQDSKIPHIPSSNNTSLLNHMGSPALSACSAMSTRSTRFARDDNNRLTSSTAAAKHSSKKYTSKADTHHKVSSHSSSTNTASSTPHTLLKQLLKCGNADVVTQSKPAASSHVIMASNALSGLQTPSRMISTGSYQEGQLISGHDK